MGRARISTSLLPCSYSHEADVSVVVDVLRATSTLVTMFERGLVEALIASSIEDARTLAAPLPDYLVCGEEGGLPPEGFDYGNSPVEVGGLDLRGRNVIFATTNGTRALQSARASKSVLVGALLNAAAVAKVAVDGVGDIQIICAGERGGTAISLEDVFCAGAIVERMTARAPFELDDGSTIAVRVYQSFGCSGSAALRFAEHGRALHALGLGDDVSFCARLDEFATVPCAVRDSRGVLRVLATLGGESGPPVA